MRLSVLLVVLGMLGLIGGAWLVGMWAVGCAVMADSLALIALGLLREGPDRRAERPTGVRERMRAA